MLLIRSIVFTHEAVRDWEVRLAPLLAERLRKRRAGKAGRGWHVDETYDTVGEFPSRVPTGRIDPCVSIRTQSASSLPRRRALPEPPSPRAASSCGCVTSSVRFTRMRISERFTPARASLPWLHGAWP